MRVFDKVLFLALISVSNIGCDAHDGDYFPFLMEGLNVWVYDNDAGEERFAGFIEGTYFSKDETLSRCAALAYAYAEEHEFEATSHICCTVTSSSSCATKVR